MGRTDYGTMLLALVIAALAYLVYEFLCHRTAFLKDIEGCSKTLLPPIPPEAALPSASVLLSTLLRPGVPTGYVTPLPPVSPVPPLKPSEYAWVSTSADELISTVGTTATAIVNAVLATPFVFAFMV